VSRRALCVPAVVLLVAGLLAVAITVIAVGAGVTSPTPVGCPRSAGLDPAAVDTAAVGSAARAASLDAGQLANAWIIYSVGVGLGLPPPAEVVAIATAMQESALENLPYGSSDSLGLFQQRPSQGWGSPAQIMDPVTSARAFYERLVQVADWQSLPVTVAAQDVQHSAYASAYARWQAGATRLVASFAGGAGACAVLAANVVPAGASAKLPRHFSLPAGTPFAVALAIRFAIAQLGTAYDFGGTCTDAHSSDMALHCDCSSLVQQSYKAGGVPLPRTTFSQVDVGTPVYSMYALRPGDLLFIAGSDGSSSNPGHVGMYLGDGLVIQAPETGQDVELSPMSEWTSAIVAMRRIA
jgi:cell wall-associated NlpC family hydrolase